MSTNNSNKEKEILDKLISESKREPVLLHRETDVLCPACGSKSMEVNEYLYDVPYFNTIIISVGKCKSCGYSFRDVRVAEVLKPRKILIKVSGERELRLLIAKSPMSSILIKELGASMTPGPASVGFITTVEGLIERFIEVASHVCKNLDEASKSECYDTLEKLKMIKDGRFNATIIICDYDGLTRIAGEGLISEVELDYECEELKPEWLKSATP
ncbi:MAG: ZPR1 zinc finger domain-containing protein [Desulfurococcales archaeon]|nr:ZPR1 zinc finger domain-containing protein [Desulfurococcales archaeon]